MTRRRFAGAACIGIAAATGVFVALREPRTDRKPGVVSGVVVHDFGQHVLDGPLDLEHTFQLRNTMTEPLVIRKIVASCGCTKALVSSERIEPGATFDVMATLTLASAGKRREESRLVCDRIEPVVLTLQAAARVTEGMYCAQRSVHFDNHNMAHVCVIQLSFDDVKPGRLVFETPAAVRATADEWTMVSTSRATIRQPSRWHAWIHLERLEEAAMTNAEL